MSKLPWWRRQMETFSALLTICSGNSPVPGEFPTQWPVTLSFDVYFDLPPNKRLNKQSWGWWFETPSDLLCSHRNVSGWIAFGIRTWLGDYILHKTTGVITYQWLSDKLWYVHFVSDGTEKMCPPCDVEVWYENNNTCFQEPSPVIIMMDGERSSRTEVH